MKILKLKPQTSSKTTFFISCFLFLSLNIKAKMFKFKTKHLEIAYEEGLERSALQLKDKGDIVAEKLFSFFNFYPDKRIRVIIKDNNIENAFVITVDPYKVYLFPNTPSPKSIEKNYDNWIEYVFSHELTHSLIAMMSTFNYFGWRLKAASVPSWLHEGSAVYVETNLLGKGGRGNSNTFLSYIKSHEQLSLDIASPLLGQFPYSLGYSYLKNFEQKYGEDTLIKVIKKKASDNNYFSTLDYFDEEINESTIDKWNENHKKLIPQGKKYSDEKVSMLDGYKDTLFQYDGTYLTYRDFNENIEKYRIIRGIKHFSFKNGISYVKMFASSKSIIKLESKAYIDGKYTKLDNPNKIFKGDDEVIYSSRKAGVDKLLSDKRGILIGEKQGLIFNKILTYKDEIFFLASLDEKPESYIYSLKEDELLKICEALSFSIYEDKIYFTKNDKESVNIFEYNIKSKYISKVSDTFFAESPVRIKDKIYYLSLDEGYKYIYSFDVPNDFSEKYKAKVEYIDIIKDGYEEITLEGIEPYYNSFKYLPIGWLYVNVKLGFFGQPIVKYRGVLHNLIIEDLLNSATDIFIESNFAENYDAVYGIEYTNYLFDVILGKGIFKHSFTELLPDKLIKDKKLRIKYDETIENLVDFAFRIKLMKPLYEIESYIKTALTIDSTKTYKIDMNIFGDIYLMSANYESNIDTKDYNLTFNVNIANLEFGVKRNKSEKTNSISEVNSIVSSYSLFANMEKYSNLYNLSYTISKDIDIHKGTSGGGFLLNKIVLSWKCATFYSSKKFDLENPKGSLFSMHYYKSRIEKDINNINVSNIQLLINTILIGYISTNIGVKYTTACHKEYIDHHFGLIFSTNI